MPRIIARYKSDVKGPLLIAVGGLHGNEHAGVQAIKDLEAMLQAEPSKNPSFVYRGDFIGLCGNMSAITQGVRHIDADLNRVWTTDYDNIAANEYQEREELMATIHQAVVEHDEGYPVYLMDIHTTSSPRGIFAVPTQEPSSLYISSELHCPVIVNLTQMLKGSMIQYYADHKVAGVQLVSFAFEAGRHDDVGSVSRAIAAIVNCMRSISAVSEEDVESRHDEVLKAYAEGLPKFCELAYIHRITDENAVWDIKPGYEGFQKVKKGEVIAKVNGENVEIPMDGLLLMPLYQKQGKEGFFIVTEV